MLSWIMMSFVTYLWSVENIHRRPRKKNWPIHCGFIISLFSIVVNLCLWHNYVLRIKRKWKLDNASYHNLQVEGSKLSTTATKKEDMISWLQHRHVTVDHALKKPQIYEIVKGYKEQTGPTNSVDSYLQLHGHQVLRLPPYHCELNLIVLIWGRSKTVCGPFEHHLQTGRCKRAYWTGTATNWPATMGESLHACAEAGRGLVP